MDITTILWMFFIGGSAAIISVYYNNRFLGGMVRALISIDATSPETAMSADEIGIKITPMLRHALRPGTSFSETVIKTIDNRYYIAPDKLSIAKSKYHGKDTSLMFVITSILLLLFVTLAMTYILPDVIKGFSDKITGIFGEGK